MFMWFYLHQIKINGIGFVGEEGFIFYFFIYFSKGEEARAQ